MQLIGYNVCEVKTMSFIERLKKYIKEENIKQIDIAKKANMSRGSVSNVISGRRQPNEELLTALSEISGRSINWWLHGTDEYDNLYSLNSLLDYFIKDGSIKNDGSMEDETRQIIYTMLEKEIRVKLEKAQR
jgi:transcriptional regulator with XRE-family HTH domain